MPVLFQKKSAEFQSVVSLCGTGTNPSPLSQTEEPTIYFQHGNIFQTSKCGKVYQVITQAAQEVLLMRNNLKEHWFSINLDMEIFI